MPRYQPLLAGALSLFLLALTVPELSLAQPRELTEGRHFSALAQPLPDPGGRDRIVVEELFWYGCPLCASLSPLMNTWRDGIRGDLSFARSPLVWNRSMRRHARIYFTAEALGLGDAFHHGAFDAIHQQGRALVEDADIAALFAEHGVGAATFKEAWTAAAVSEAVEDAAARSERLKAQRLPALLVDGRYLVARSASVPDHQEMIIVANLLIKKLRDERRDD